VIAHLFSGALRQISRFKLQSALAIIGVTIGVANIILLISITDLGRRQATGLIDEFGANLLIITPFLDVSKGPLGGHSSLLSQHIPDRARVAVESVPEIESVSGALLMPSHAAHGEVSCYTTMQGVSPSFNIMRGYEIENGRWLTDTDIDQKARVAVLGDTVVRKLYSEGGEVLGTTVEIKDEEFLVIGTMEFKGRVGFEDVDNRIMLPLSTVQEIYGFNGVHGMFARYREGVAEAAAIAAVEAQLESLLVEGEQLDETFSVFTIKEARKMMGEALSLFRTVLWGISSIALIVAGLGIMNVMLIRVMQRRSEIGIRLAVGATPRGIALHFIAESAVQALAGALLGTGLGIAGVHIYCRYAEWSPYVSPWTIVISVLFGLVTGIVFGWYPAIKAAREDPVEVLRQV